MRLIQLLKQQGLTTSQIKVYQLNNQILVNGTKQKLACPLVNQDVVTLNGEVIKEKPLAYYLYNKPVGVVCTNNPSVKNSIAGLFKGLNASCVGRLDKESHGLIILTNDGQFSRSVLTSEEFAKTYLVEVEGPITEEFKQRMSEPFVLRGRTSKEVAITYLDDFHFEITLKEGMYHQIRKMVIASHNRVTDLYRIQIGPYLVEGLPEGQLKQIDK